MKVKIFLSAWLISMQFSFSDNLRATSHEVETKVGQDLPAVNAPTEPALQVQKQSDQLDADFSFVGVNNILFLLDCSNSMKENRKGIRRSKMSEAKALIGQIISSVPATTMIGLRVFGEKYTGVADIDCQETALETPLGLRNGAKIVQQLTEIEPCGLSPLTFALRKTFEEDLENIAGRSVVILISDGADTCGGDPNQYAKRLSSEMTINATIAIVSFEANQNSKRENRLKDIAATLHGKYYSDLSLSSILADIRVLKNSSHRK
jgi:Ca-activated chloride channel homolog